MNKPGKWLEKTVIIVGWLLCWQILSWWVDNSILLVGPWETLTVLLDKLVKISFWKTIVGSLVRIVAGFLAGWVAGLLLAALSAADRRAEAALKPIMTLMKTVPVASFVVLFLIWFRSDMLSIAISLCVVLPSVYLNTLEGIKSTDKKLLEMARVHGVHPLDRFFYIYRSALKPFWDSSMKLTVGMSWKSGVAAEVIGTPGFSIGEQLYLSKIHLDTAGVLAWTAVIIVVSIACEKGFMKLWHGFLEWQPKCRNRRNKADLQNGFEYGMETEQDTILILQDISKAYGENQVLNRFNAAYKKGQVYYFRTLSGSGKTTLFRLIAGLERCDSGTVRKNGSLAFAFQEDRLCEEYSALKNVELVAGDEKTAYRYLIPLLDEMDIQKNCSQLSGGMKRRVAVARAFAAQSDIVLLDEPFAGLDEENRRRMQEYIEECGERKVVLIATHV